MVPKNVISAISAYHTEGGHPRWVPLQTSGIYALFPDEATSVRFDARRPDARPLGDRPGVYLIFGPEMQLLYVGQTRWLAARLNTHFRPQSGPGSACRVVNPCWRSRPTFVASFGLLSDET